MAYVHLIAQLAGGGRKTFYNKTEEEILSGAVVEFLSSGTVSWTWGPRTHVKQALELRIYETEGGYDKKTGGDFDSFVSRRKNRLDQYAAKAQKLLTQSRARAFVVMPIQGEEYGAMEQQRIFREFDQRFRAIGDALEGLGCVAIRIDQEAPLDEGLVESIKAEIRRAAFVVADLTDERPSCYYEVGYADGHGVPVICVASEDSVLHPGQKTRIHFDIHRNVLFFSNHTQLQKKLTATFDKNRELLLARGAEPVIVGGDG